MEFPILLERDDDTFLVTCPDLPEVTTFGDDREDAQARAVDAIEEAIAARIARREDVPTPSSGDLRVELPALTGAKVALYQACRDAGISKAELSRRLGWHAPQVDRLYDLNHASRLEQIDQALRAVGKRIVLDVTRMEPVDRNAPVSGAPPYRQAAYAAPAELAEPGESYDLPGRPPVQAERRPGRPRRNIKMRSE